MSSPARGLGVTLVARREDRLQALADELTGAHGIRAEVIAADLTDETSRARIATELADRGLDGRRAGQQRRVQHDGTGVGERSRSARWR